MCYINPMSNQHYSREYSTLLPWAIPRWVTLHYLTAVTYLTQRFSVQYSKLVMYHTLVICLLYYTWFVNFIITMWARLSKTLSSSQACSSTWPLGCQLWHHKHDQMIPWLYCWDNFIWDLPWLNYSCYRITLNILSLIIARLCVPSN